MRVLRFIPLVSVGLVLAACEQPLTSPDVPVDPPSFASVNAEPASSVKQSIFFVAFVPCVPEFITGTGTLHIVTHLSSDNHGGFHFKVHFQPQGLSATGAVTGDTYRAVGVTQETFNAVGAFEDTFVNNFRMIGTGKGAVSFHVHQTRSTSPSTPTAT